MKNLTYSKRVLSLPENIIDSVYLKAAEIHDVIFLAGGTPSLSIPNKIWEELFLEAKRNIKISQYSHNVLGDEELRVLIAQDLSREFGYKVREEEILLTVGSSASLFAVFQALINPYDDVLWITPGYPGNIAQINLTGGNIKEVVLKENKSWEIDFTKLQKTISEKTKLFIYAEPLNPTGTVFSLKEKKELLRIANKHNFLLVADETYRHLIFPEVKFKSIMAFPESKNTVVLVRSFSKDFSMSGLRLGFVYAPKDFIEKIESIHIAMNICAPSLAQEMAKIMLKNKNTIWSNSVKEYLCRREVMCFRLDKLKNLFSYVKPMGGFFIFLKYNIPLNSMSFFKLLLEESRVAVMPGIAFGSGGEGHIRVSFTGLVKNINSAFDRIERSLRNRRYVI